MLFAIITALTITGFLCLQVLLAKQNDASHGSNTVTRFVRNGVANHAYRRVIFLSVLAFPLQLVIGLITKSIWTVMFLLIPISLCAYFRYKSVNVQNMKDARVMTKSIGRIIQYSLPAVVGIVLGLLICFTGVGIPIGVAVMVIGIAISITIAKLTGKCMDKMTDVDAPDIQAEDFKELNATASKVVNKATQGVVNIDFSAQQGVKDVCLNSGGFPISAGADIKALPFDEADFKSKCQSLGINTEGVETDKLAKEFLQYAPMCLIEQLPSNLSDRDKAYSIIKGEVLA